MDGDVAPLKEIRALADKYNAQVFIDECHATGFFGATGRGSDEYCGVFGKIDVRNMLRLEILLLVYFNENV